MPGPVTVRECYGQQRLQSELKVLFAYFFFQEKVRPRLSEWDSFQKTGASVCFGDGGEHDLAHKNKKPTLYKRGLSVLLLPGNRVTAR